MNNTSSDWHTISESSIAEFRSDESSKEGFAFFISPMDVPEAWRLTNRKTSELDERTIEFRYLTSPEYLTSTTPSNSVKLEFGRNSKRIYKIHYYPSAIFREGTESASKEKSHHLEMIEKAILSAQSHDRLNSGNVNSILIIFRNTNEIDELLNN